MIDAHEIRRLLDAGDAIDVSLPGGGHIHVERPQPFICTYRKQAGIADDATRDLVTGQPSYLIFPSDPAGQDAATAVLLATVDHLEKTFGAALVVELFALPLTEDYLPEQGPPTPAFEIRAQPLLAPLKTIEALEQALLAQIWPGGVPEIREIDCSSRAPRDCAPLLTPEICDKEDVTDLALGIRSIYLEAQTGTVLPSVWRQVNRSLSIALRQCFYIFAHTRARYQPAHFHELGTHEIEGMVMDVDRAIAAVGDRVELILDATPVNSANAWEQFHTSGYQTIPEFHYRPLRHDLGTLKRQLYEVHLERVEDPALHMVYSEKRKELDSQIDMLGDRASKRFLYGSLQVYGAPDVKLITLARSILEAIQPPSGKSAGRGSTAGLMEPQDFASHARRALGHYRAERPDFTAKVELRDDLPGIIVSGGNLLIGANAIISAKRAEAIIAHEVETHMLTFQNGLAQPFQVLHTGMAGYEALQEGLAVIAEYLVGGLNRSRMRLLAGRVLAVAGLVDGADFVDTFRSLSNEHSFSHRAAYGIAMRVHRSGGLTKDMVYLEGLSDLLNHLGDTDMPFENLLVGKFALNQIDLIDELQWRNILKRPILLPRYLQDAGARRRLDRLRQGASVLDLVNGDDT